MLDLETGLVLGNLEVNQSLSILKDLIQSLMNIVSDKLTQLKLKLASLGWGVGPMRSTLEILKRSMIITCL